MMRIAPRHGSILSVKGHSVPNQGECFGQGTATFLILGKTCTRNCTFCAIPTEERPPAPDPQEPAGSLRRPPNWG